MKGYVFFLLMMSGVAPAQDIVASLPAEEMIAPEDRKVLDRQAGELFRKWDRQAAPLSRSVVSFISGNGRRRVALGTVVGRGKVLTKLSDLEHEGAPVVLRDADGKIHDGRVLFSIPEYDLIMMDVPGLEVPPVDLNDCAQTEEGDLIAAVSPGGHVSDFGVVSVAPRSLREGDLPYLGIAVDRRGVGSGVLIGGVEPDSGAERLGLQKGDVLLSLNDRPVDGVFSIRSAVAGVTPGQSVPLEVLRKGQRIKADLVTGHRPKVVRFPQKRLEQMNIMGNRLSLKRDGFPLVIQSDMSLYPESAGCPVIDIRGKFAGLALSRAGRTETYVLPAWVCKELVEGVLPKWSQRWQSGDPDIPDAQEVEETYDSQRLEENKRRIEDHMRKHGLSPQVY
jgi:S1-C subfamily serine protease